MTPLGHPHLTAPQAQAAVNGFTSDHLLDRFVADQARWDPIESN